MASSSRTLLVGILVSADRALTAAQLIRLAAPLGLSPTNVKSHLTRMVAEGALQRDGPPRLAAYSPTEGQAMVIEGIRARLADRPDELWDGRWMMLSLMLPQKRGDREQVRASLWFDGWRPAGAEVFLRPAWPRQWSEESARRHLGHVPGLCVRGELVPEAAEPCALYDLDRLDSRARRLSAWSGRRTARPMSSRAAFAERMRVGGRVAQFIGQDPRLPEAVWGGRVGMTSVIESFRQFEERVAPEARKFVDEVIGRY